MKEQSAPISKKDAEYLYRLQKELHRLRIKLTHQDLGRYWHELTLSWIYHDNSLEGVVLTLQELKLSLEGSDRIDISMIPESDVIIAHNNAIAFIKELAERRKLSITLPLIKEIYRILTPQENETKQIPFRRETPLHRLYFHEISDPAKIAYRMKKFVDWTGTAQARKMHPVQFASEVHYRLIAIYPFAYNSGKLSRLVMNMILLHHGFEPIIIHATERQRYYEVLQEPSSSLIHFLLDSMRNTMESTIKYFAPLAARRR